MNEFTEVTHTHTEITGRVFDDIEQIRKSLSWHAQWLWTIALLMIPILVCLNSIATSLEKLAK